MKTFTAVALAALLATSTLGLAADADMIIEKEKATWEAWKNKDEAGYRKLCAAEYREIMPSRIGDLNASMKSMKETEMKSYSFNDPKCIFPDPETAIVTYKVTVNATQAGKDISGTYNSGGVWRKMGADWRLIFYGEAKPEKTAAPN
ncbi:MAG: nuclear transport factor 2 family protein [Verrucomicrobiota bacterium]|nr:nuclear transport factor 2 family protein [Verrucomicrobiota bacterium]